MNGYEKKYSSKEHTKKVLEYVNTCQEFSVNNINYRFFTDSVKELSGACLVGLNLINEEDKSKTSIKAVSGASKLLSRLMTTLGFNLEGSEWDTKNDAINISERNKLIYFSSFEEIGYYKFMPRLAPALKIIEKKLLTNGLYAMVFQYQEEFLGIITLIMPKDKDLENKELITLYINQIAGTIKRLRTEKKLQQKMNDLQESETKFRTYIEEAPLGIFVTDNTGQYIAANRAACQMSGYTEAELLNLTIPDFLDPKFLTEGMKLFKKLLVEGTAEADVMVRKKSGETLWINLAGVSINNGKVIAFCQDITKRKESEERAKELNCLYSFSRLLKNNQNNLIKILEGIVQILPAAFQYPDDASARIMFKGREFKTQNFKSTPWNISAPLELFEEHTGFIEVSYMKPPIQEQETFIKEEELMLGTIAEHLSRVAEQIQTEKDLKISKNHLLTTLHSIGDGVIVTDISGKITRLNPQAEKLTGWTSKEALGRDLHEVFHIIDGKTGELAPNPVYRVINTGKTQAMKNGTILISRDGTNYHIADSAAPILDGKDKMYDVIMVFSDVTKRKKAEVSLKYHFRFEIMLANISSTFASQPSEQLEQGIQYTLQQVGNFFQVDRCYVVQFSDDGNQIINTYEWCAEGSKIQRDQIQNMSINTFSWWKHQITKNKIINIPNVENLPVEAATEQNEYKSQGIHSHLSIPLIQNGLAFGFLGLDTVKEKKWTENHIMLLTVVAELVSRAYTRNLAEEKIRYQSFHDDLTGLYNRVYLEKEMDRLDTERQLPIGIIMADLNSLKLLNDTFGHDVGDEMLRKTAEILKNSCRSEDIIARWGGDEFVILLPQTTEEDAKAILNRIEGKCKETDVRDILLSLALGNAIKKKTGVNLVEILKEAEENMYKNKLGKSQHMKDNVLNLIYKKLELISYETAFHYSTMQNIAHTIGKKIELAQSELSKLKKVISLHDIGKINISEEILTKKNTLTEKEWEFIKKHPEVGYRIARATGESDEIAENILSHHEWWDGSGYPQGLKSKEIPLLARITAIADAYEVMNTGRPYKKAMSKNEVMTELKKCSGSQFDPELINIFLLILKER